MTERIEVLIDGRVIAVDASTHVAAAIAIASAGATRRSVRGMPRTPACGMGICQECRVTIDGVPHHLACQTPCAPGMRVSTMGKESS